ncbi:ParB/RepB/Spo0J family partition protein [Algirhabdus cladophorae]|uniref:ParB/RepB/Spo0J family partition protein n=1 Tax=Algirhabdus cladophorae TaxID=3377108 RepID=UPI003B84A06C
MSKKPNKTRGLGRGLSALMADVEPQSETTQQSASAGAKQVDIDLVTPNPDQPRRDFSAEELEELAQSIQAHGVIQPLIVRPAKSKSGMYEIVAGERRWRASQIASLHQVPVLVREYSDRDILEIAIIENVQRQDLNPLEEAMAYDQLVQTFGHTQQELATAMGKSRSYVANLLRLVTLPDVVKEYLRSGQLTAGHARALITADDPISLAHQIVKGGLSVRQAESLAKAKKPSKTNPSAGQTRRQKDADTKVLEDELTAQLGMRVVIDHSENAENGKITISYKSLEGLDDLCRLLAGN